MFSLRSDVGTDFQKHRFYKLSLFDTQEELVGNAKQLSQERPALPEPACRALGRSWAPGNLAATQGLAGKVAIHTDHTQRKHCPSSSVYRQEREKEQLYKTRYPALHLILSQRNNSLQHASPKPLADHQGSEPSVNLPLSQHLICLHKDRDVPFRSVPWVLKK